ncbi:MAG: glutaconyl-CoA decarboxylase subunit alpha [Deltaproteobacteria bacterium]|nr:glutaconyl-CoA decarboxylase subunit alpha [Deltaproteobacteria bacterium]
MKQYFAEMPLFGKPLKDKQKEKAAESAAQIKKVEEQYAAEVERVKNAGLPAERINQRGEMTAWQRLEYLLDPGTFLPMNTIFDPNETEEGTTGVINGLAKISGRWVSVIASDNKVLAGAWIGGQAENIFRAQDMAERLRIPLIWVLNCSGVKLTTQQEVYAGRRSGGRTFFRHAELAQKGIPVIVGMYGTNPAGGGYHAISPAIIFAHKNSNMAVGGGGIVGGMSPKGHFDLEGAEALIESTRHFKAVPPGSPRIHHDKTGFMREVFDTEEGVLDAIKKCVAGLPSYDPAAFRVAEPKEPRFPGEDLNYLVPFNQKATYNMDEVIARLVDNSEHSEFRPDYGPEIYCALTKIDGFPVGIVANRQGFLGANYPEYADYTGIGGKLYRQGLIKMSDFTTYCGRDRIPMIWIQDTSGIDVGDIAEEAELLGLGMSLIYSIESSRLPMMTVVLRKGTAAAHYVMCGPQGNRNNAFTLGTPTTEVEVMHGETAAAAAFARRLVKEKDKGNDLQPVIDKMNALAKQYYDQSRPDYCVKHGFVDEIVSFPKLRDYMVAFTQAVFQNPDSICPHHQMLLPRIIRDNV